jgi:DNA-binding NarL/FixJ family response regulator
MELLEAALATARELGMAALEQRCLRVMETFAGRPSYPDALSTREVEVLQLLASGLSNHEIGGRLFISTHTVASHIRNILGKTGAANRTEAAAYAIRQGLTPG